MKKFYKNIMSITVCLLACVCLVACGGKKETYVFQAKKFSAENPVFVANSGEPSQLSFEKDVVVIPKSTNGLGYFTKFGEYRTAFPENGYSTFVTIYIDPSQIVEGEGFSFTSAINDKSGNFLTEQITHIRKLSEADTIGTTNGGVPFDHSELRGKVLIGHKNGRDNAQVVNPYDGNVEYSGVQISIADWYTFKTDYVLNNNELYTTIRITNSKSNVVYEQVANNLRDDASAPSYQLDNVGGNRYGWFSYNNIAGGLKVCEVALKNN